MLLLATALLVATEETRLVASRALRLAERVKERPTKDDVERISWGKAAKKRGTGSRGIPHRLNNDERKLYELAKGKGYVEMKGSGYRHERRDAPLVNTWSLWCGAVSRPAIVLHKPNLVIVDFAPLKLDDETWQEDDDFQKYFVGAPLLKFECEELAIAKKQAAIFADLFEMPKSSMSKKQPNVRPGKSRRHGGYGIG